MISKYNNTYHRSIEIKPVDEKLGTYINFVVKSSDKGHKLEIGDHVRKSKYKKILKKRLHSKDILKQSLELKEDVRKNVINYMSSGRAMIIGLVTG